MTQHILSVTQINEYIKHIMDADGHLANIAVQGEISNYKTYPSGHHYFTIKDEGAALKCVMFRNNALRLRFRPENGMKVIAIGGISVYPRDGAYQLYCTALTPEGIGDLHTAFEQLKQKLAKQGLFDPAHKKALPQYPKTIGIITSSAGAAIHDMLRIIKKRFPLTTVRLLPVRVQGVEAPGEISAAIRYANRHNLADVLIVGRGGGSIEDLWAFNDETVAQAIYDSKIPVISAVGHEPDVTISDYVADLRAATPSNAAELVVPDQDAIRQQLDSVMFNMTTSVMRQLRASRQHLRALSASAILQDPVRQFTLRREKIHFSATKLIAAQRNILNSQRNRFSALTAKLDAMSPLRVLSRGYAMVSADDGTVIRSQKQVHTGDAVRLTFTDGTVSAKID